jgi:hypothetical protein
VAVVAHAPCPGKSGDAAKRERCDEGNQCTFHRKDLSWERFGVDATAKAMANDADSKTRL